MPSERETFGLAAPKGTPRGVVPARTNGDATRLHSISQGEGKTALNRFATEPVIRLCAPVSAEPLARAKQNPGRSAR